MKHRVRPVRLVVSLVSRPRWLRFVPGRLHNAEATTSAQDVIVAGARDTGRPLFAQ